MEYVPCIGKLLLQFFGESFWNFTGVFKDGLKICILFFQNPEIIFYHFLRIFNLDIFSSPYTTDMYMEYVPCIGNSSYSFLVNPFETLPIFFKDGLEICILFFQNPEIIFLSLFFPFFNLDIFSSPYTTDMYMEYIPCIGNSSYSFWRILLKLYSCFSGWSEDMHIVFLRILKLFFFAF